MVPPYPGDYLYRFDYFIAFLRYYCNSYDENLDGRRGAPTPRISVEYGYYLTELIGDRRRFLGGGAGAAPLGWRPRV